MFTQNARHPVRLTRDQHEIGYFLLYYQFIKHAFGLRQMPILGRETHLRLYFDEFPNKKEHAEQFKGFIFGLQMEEPLVARKIRIRMSDIAEVRSHDHILLQCLDVILGAMTFRLNNKHKHIPEGQTRRGKRTVAKEKLYKHVLTEIRRIRPGFNIGETTGKEMDWGNLWSHPYRHWKFIPTESSYDESLTKGAEKRRRPS